MQTNSDATKSKPYLALGDSYTIGERVDASARWPVQLAELLRQNGVDVADPDIIAETGWTANELRKAIRNADNRNTYDLVSLLTGVNNQYRGLSLNRYRADLRNLLQTAIQLAGGKARHVFALSIPDWGASPFAKRRDRVKIAQEIDKFNAIARDECRRANVMFIDITPLTRQAAGDATQFAEDGLHYSNKQMKQWAEKALPAVKPLLLP